MTTGTIRFWNAERGFGFLVPSGTADPSDKSQDCFLHTTVLQACDVPENPAPGKCFEYEVALDARGRRYAARVKPVAGGPDA